MQNMALGRNCYYCKIEKRTSRQTRLITNISTGNPKQKYSGLFVLEYLVRKIFFLETNKCHKTYQSYHVEISGKEFM
jgi:hypothetical protein